MELHVWVKSGRLHSISQLRLGAFFAVRRPLCTRQDMSLPVRRRRGPVLSLYPLYCRRFRALLALSSNTHPPKTASLID
jgi:hypothetical protein